MKRRTLIHSALATALTGLAASAGAQMRNSTPRIEVWKDPNCGCCDDWITYVEANGFEVRAHNAGNQAARRRLGMPESLGSCHTALVGGYVIEGHVPAAEIHRLLQERPQALGLSVPGMPIGSPGMDGPIYGGRQDPYHVLLVQRDGSRRVFASYHQPEGSQPMNREGLQQTRAEAASSTDSQGRPWVEAEVSRLDSSGQRISLRHGPIPNLDMPPMRMIFRVSDPAMLDQVKAGERIRFSADRVNGQYTVMEWQPME